MVHWLGLSTKPLTADHNKLWKILKEMGIPNHITYLLRNLYAGHEATLWTGSKLGKEYIKVIICHPDNLTYIQSTSCEMLGWMKHKRKSRLPREISITSDMLMTPPLQTPPLQAESEEELKSLLRR